MRKENTHTHETFTEQSVLLLLSQRGYRITEPRRAIVRALFGKSLHAFSALDLGKKLPTIELSTIYRTLLQLEKEGVVREFQKGDTSYFEVTATHHDHLECVMCGKIEHIPCVLIKSPRIPPKWKVIEHQVFFTGVCTHCV